MRTDIETAINRTRRRLGLEHTTMHEAALRTYVDEGVNHLQTLDNFVVSCETIDIECGKGDLPDSCDTVLAISPVRNDNGTCCLCAATGAEQLQALSVMNTRCGCLPFYVSDSSMLISMCDSGATCGLNEGIFYTQGGKLILRSSAEGQMKVWFKGKNVDCDGIMIVDEDWVRGISAYAAYQFASSGMNFNKYNYRQMKDWQSEWTAQKAYQQGVSQKKYFQKNKARFTAIANAILVNPMVTLIPNP